MSAKNLLEMDELSRSFATERGLKPKPRPRNLSRQSTSGKQVVDDVMSMSSIGSSANEEENTRVTKTFHKNKPTVSSAFENPSFFTDDDPVKSNASQDSLIYNNDTPVPLQKSKPSFKSSVERHLHKSESRQSRMLSFERNSHDESDNSLQAIGKLSTIEDTCKVKEDDFASDSTYTVENERYRESTHLTAKPPKPRSKKSKLPQKTVRITSASEQEISDDDKSSHVHESLPAEKGKNKDYMVVQIDQVSDSHDINSGKADSESIISISSTATSTKETVKSRLGKLFSSSDDKAKTQEHDKEKTKEKSNSVNRWNWKNAFSRSSKSIEEGDEEGTTNQQKNPLPTISSEENFDNHGKKETETKIFIPELSSDEDVSTKFPTNVKSEKNSKKEEKEKDHKVSERKTFAKLLRSRSKETVEIPDRENANDKHSNEQAKPKSTEKVGNIKSSKPKRKSKHDNSDQLKEITAIKPLRRKSDSEDLSEQNISNTASESDDQDLPKKSPKRKPKKQSAKPTETIPFTDSSGTDFLFGITIHSSDILPLDPNVIHPVVKVTAMFQNGTYIHRSKNISAGESKSNKSKSEKRSKRTNKKTTDVEKISTTNVADSVLSIMSQPFHARYPIPTFAPNWNELLVFEEPLKRFGSVEYLNSNENDNEPILFFEIMDFLPINKNQNASKPGFHGSDEGWYKVAWAFLKPIGANGVPNLNKKLRLQLFKPVKLQTREKLQGPEVFSWWKCGRKEKINCTLYVTPKGIVPPEIAKTSLQQLLSMRKEHLTQAILDSQIASERKNGAHEENFTDEKEQPNWSRMKGQSCKPPNKLVASLPSSQVESLNLVIAGNVHCVKFSPCGTKLVAGLDTDELHVILMFQIPSGGLVKTLKGHHGIVYDITWNVYQLDSHTSYQYLASASADSTVRIWKMRNNNEKSLSLQTVLYHPSYVYCVKFHPKHQGILATGCFDNIIRIWDMELKHPDSEPRINHLDRKRNTKGVSRNELSLSPYLLLDKHSSFVNCIMFDTEGQHLYSGDGKSYLYKWACKMPGIKKSWKLVKDSKMHHPDIPVNSLDLHPSGNRLLVHLRDNSIKILDITSFIPLQSFPGIRNEKFQIKSCFSPCGNLVLSGSEDGSLCIWDADTGKILQFNNVKNHGHCIVSSVDYHPWDYYVAVGLASTTSEPSPVLLYFYEQSSFLNYPLLKQAAQKWKSSRSQSGEMMDEVDDINQKRPSPLLAKRGDSSEKFISIIRKLDNALYLAQQRNQQRQSEAQSSTCAKSPIEESTFNQKIDLIDPQTKNLQSTLMEPFEDNVLQIKKSASASTSATVLTQDKRDKYKNSIRNSVKSDSEDATKTHVDVHAVKTSNNIDATENNASEDDLILKETPVRLERKASGESKNNNEHITKTNQVANIKPIPIKRRSKANNNATVIRDVEPE